MNQNMDDKRLDVVVYRNNNVKEINTTIREDEIDWMKKEIEKMGHRVVVTDNELLVFEEDEE